jgi:hypothetical protein
MKSKTPVKMLTIGLFLLVLTQASTAAADGFGAVVKLVEQFYRVKHQGIPLLARAGMKAATTAARIKGGEARRLAEAGSVKVAIFEDQAFDSHGAIADFKSSLSTTLGTGWIPLVQTLSPKEEQQTHVFLSEAGEKFHVLVVSIDKRDAAVVQVTLKPATLALLMQNPDDMGRAITEDATTNDPE